MFNLKEKEEYGVFRERFQFLGYQTTNLIYNMNTSFVFVYAFPVLVLAFLIIRKIQVKR